MAASMTAALVDKLVSGRMEVASVAGAIMWACNGTTAPATPITEDKRLTHEGAPCRRTLYP